MAGAGRRLGPVALLPPAALAVHQLRFLLAYGDGAGAELQRTGHAYLHSVVPWIVLLLALATGGFLRSLGRALGGRASRGGRTVSFTGLWLACAAALTVIFACQEVLEGVYATGHSAGMTGIFGYGGWWAIPASLCVGLLLAACLHGARWVLDEVAERGTRGRVAWAPLRLVVPTARAAAGMPPAPLVGGWSDRGPPR